MHSENNARKCFQRSGSDEWILGHQIMILCNSDGGKKLWRCGCFIFCCSIQITVSDEIDLSGLISAIEMVLWNLQGWDDDMNAPGKREILIVGQ